MREEHREKKRQRSLGTRALMAAITLAVLAYFGVQAVRYIRDPMATMW